MPHSGRGLFDHLLATRRLLVEWEARPALWHAGLFHSVYSTKYYELNAIPLSVPLTEGEFRDLVTMTFANCLDFSLSLAGVQRRREQAEFE